MPNFKIKNIQMSIIIIYSANIHLHQVDIIYHNYLINTQHFYNFYIRIINTSIVRRKGT